MENKFMKDDPVGIYHNVKLLNDKEAEELAVKEGYITIKGFDHALLNWHCVRCNGKQISC